MESYLLDQGKLSDDEDLTKNIDPFVSPCHSLPWTFISKLFSLLSDVDRQICFVPSIFQNYLPEPFYHCLSSPKSDSLIN